MFIVPRGTDRSLLRLCLFVYLLDFVGSEKNTQTTKAINLCLDMYDAVPEKYPNSQLTVSDLYKKINHFSETSQQSLLQ